MSGGGASGDEELSIGDYVLSGANWRRRWLSTRSLVCCQVWWETKTRRSTNRLRTRECWIVRTGRPGGIRGWKAPDVLLGGNHAEIRKWRKQRAGEDEEAAADLIGSDQNTIRGIRNADFRSDAFGMRLLVPRRKIHRDLS